VERKQNSVKIGVEVIVKVYLLMIKKIYKKKALKVLTIIMIPLFLGVLWQYIMCNYESKRYAPPGQLIDVKGHKMHIYARGEGSPTVILTVGSGTPSAYTDYYYIQNELMKVTRTVSYDRPGFGWSEGTSIRRTIDDQVNDLRELLNISGEKPPYILVGHSLASLEVIHYAQLFPKEVAGIVLIDGGNPTYYAHYNESSALALNFLFEGIRKSGLLRALGNVGVFLPLVGETERHKLLPQELRKLDEIMFYKNVGNEFNRNSLKNINENARKVINNGKLGDIPLVILTAGKEDKWKASQEELKTWSNNSKQENIIDSTHYIHWNNWQIVTDKIRELVINSKRTID
jgi:pimeloyl-ACP methyl ester carboxylesterase